MRREASFLRSVRPYGTLGSVNRELSAAELVTCLRGFQPAALTTSSGQWHRWADRRELDRHARGLGFDGVEWTCEAGGIPELARFLETGGGSGRVSVHAPCGVGAMIGLLPETVEQVVFHPNTLEDLRPVRALGARAAIENMDARKPTGRTVDELELFFAELPQARFCFDVAHALHHDATLELGLELADRFADRLGQLHVSVLAPDCWHLPLTSAAVEKLRPLLERCRHVPWVIEAPWADGPCDPALCERCARHRRFDQ